MKEIDIEANINALEKDRQIRRKYIIRKSMASVVDICNGALNQLGATTIVSLNRRFKKR